MGDQHPMVLVPEVDEHIQMILDQIVSGIDAIGVQLVIVQPTLPALLERCREWQETHPHAVHVIDHQDESTSACDMALLNSANAQDLQKCSAVEMVPLADAGIEPFDPIAEKGNGFLYQRDNAWSLFAALVRATETYRFPYDWKNLIKSVKKQSKLV